MQAFQENLQRSGPAATASYTLVGGVLLLGGLGYVADDTWGTAPWGFLGGVFVGMAAGFYAIIKAATPRR